MPNALLQDSKRCSAQKPDGSRCGCARRKGKPFCLFHDPDARAATSVRMKAQAAADPAQLPTLSDLAGLDLTQPGHLQTFRQGIMLLVLSGNLEPPAAGKAMECAALIAASGQAADASASSQAMAAALARALREQG
jgi:hypothetical protein